MRYALERSRETYAETARCESWLSAHQWRYGPDVADATARDVRNKLKLSAGDQVLEIGAGSGAFLATVLYESQQAVGFDFCGEQVRGSDRFGVDKRRIRLGVAEAARIPVPSESIDKVLCYSVIHHFPNDQYVRAAMHEMLRVCRVGGVVLLGDVAGVMERSRKILLRTKLPVRVVDAFLWMLLPVRNAFRKRKKKSPLEGRFYRRSQLRKMLDDLPCEYEFLDQEIPGRTVSKCRFDIRMTKTKSTEDSSVAPPSIPAPRADKNHKQ